MIIAGIALAFLTNIFCNLTDTFNGKYPLPVIILAGISTLFSLLLHLLVFLQRKQPQLPAQSSV